MKDRKGNDLAVGDRVFVLPQKHDGCNGPGFVRRILGGEARVDNGPQDMTEDLAAAPAEAWTWSAWVTPSEVEKL